MPFNTKFILLSSSKSRISILKKINLNFIHTKHHCNENYFKKKMKEKKISPKKISLELAKLKAKSISTKQNDILIIGSDTVIDLNGKLLGKPKNRKDAKNNIKKLAGRTHTIISSIAAYYNSKLVWFVSEKTKVKIRKLKKIEINDYINDCGPSILGSAGCYQIEKKGPLIIIEKINGDFFNVMGFPLFSFLKFLKKFNLKKYKK